VVLVLDNGMASGEAEEIVRGFDCRPGWRPIRISALTVDRLSSWRWHQHAITQSHQHSWEAMCLARGSYSGPHSVIFANPYLDFQFHRIWNEMALAAQIGASADAILDALRPALIVLGHEAFTLERTLVALARRKGIPSAAMLHGGWHPIRGYRGLVGDADFIMVWGDEDLQRLESVGIERARLKAIGSLRYSSRHLGNPAPPSTAERTAHQQVSRKALNLPVFRPLITLLTASINKGPVAPLADPPLHRRTWQDILQLANRHPNWTFGIKPHPAYDHYDYYQLLCRHSPSNLVLLRADLDEALAASDVAVMVNYCTTAGLEAVLHGLPLLFLRTAVYRTEDMADALQDFPDLNVTSVSELEASLVRVLGNQEPNRPTKEEAIRSLLEASLGGSSKPALERLMDSFESIAPSPVAAASVPVAGHAPTIDDRLADAAQCLLRADANLLFPSRWGALLAALLDNRPGSETLDRVMYTMSFAAGMGAERPSALRNLIQSCADDLRRVGGLDRAAGRRMLLNGYLVAGERFTAQRRWRQAFAFLLQAAIEFPHLLLGHGPFRTLLLGSMAFSHPLSAELANTVLAKGWADKMRRSTTFSGHEAYDRLSGLLRRKPKPSGV
jgi:hypothetical protein